MNHKIVSMALRLLTLVLSLLPIACNHHNKSIPPDPKPLYQSDRESLAHLASTPSSGPQVFDKAYNSSFTRVFGGPNGSDVIRYLDERVHVILSRADLRAMKVYPQDIWGSSDDLFDDTHSEDGKPSDADKGLETQAVNVGTALFLTSRFADQDMTFEINGHATAVHSTRMGLIALNDSYLDSVDTGTQKIMPPPEYRLATVVHEARHSDCTGGFPQEYVQKFADSDDMDDFLKKIGKNQFPCGHTHIACPAGSDYAGAYACDNEYFGAYGVGAIFAGGMITNYEDNTIDRRFLEVMASDSLSRLPDDALKAIANTVPDMSSKDD